ncbi:MAG: hypothetical protein NPINA01_16430 [Nitrospinaceae bacterium]|nr:MAG: hypothetical protein NPINA01_16430 [Nitrospinaceae bacterium]
MKRSMWVTVAMVVVLTGFLAIFLLFSMDSLVTMAVEKYGSDALQAEVTLDETKISATSGKGTLRGLKVGNPKGFESDSAFRLGEVSMTLDVGTITKDTVLIKEILIAGPDITYEIGATGSNLDALQKNVAQQAGGGGEKSSDEEKPSSSNKNGKKLIIDSLIIRDGKINVSAVGLKGKKLSVKLPRVQLSGIGRDKGGASPAEVIKKLMVAVNAAAEGSVRTLDLGKVLENVEGAAEVKELLEKGGSDILEKNAKGLGNAVKGLMGK